MKKQKIGLKKDRVVIGNKGMMTVEASVIVPVILMITVVQIFFSLFLIDMSVAKSEALRIAEETAAVWKTDGNLTDGSYISQQLIRRNKNFLRQKSRRKLTNKASTRLQRRISSGLNVASVELCRTKLQGDRIYTKVSLHYKSPFPGSRKYAGIAGWSFACNGIADVCKEEEILRKVKAQIQN